MERLSGNGPETAVRTAIAAVPATDPAVKQMAAAEPAASPVPDLAAPADSPAQQPAAPATINQPAPAPIAEPAPAVTAPAPADAAAPAPAHEQIVNAAVPHAEANQGEQWLSEAKELYKAGNYQGAKQLADKAKSGKFGVESQADELIAQVALAEQGGALALYESALAALRAGDNARARVLLVEVAAAGDSLDEALRAKVENLVQKLTVDDQAKPNGKASTSAIPGRRGTRRSKAQRRSRHQDRRGSPAP